MLLALPRTSVMHLLSMLVMIEDAGESDFHAVHDDSVVAMTMTMKITLVAAMLKMVSLMAMLIQLVMVLMAATVVEVMSMLTSGTSGIYWQRYSSRQQCSSMIYIYICICSIISPSSRFARLFRFHDQSHSRGEFDNVGAPSCHKTRGHRGLQHAATRMEPRCMNPSNAYLIEGLWMNMGVPSR